MGLADDALGAFNDEQEQRVYEWQSWPRVGAALSKAARVAVGRDWHPMGFSPTIAGPGDEVDVKLSWRRSAVVATFEDDPLELFLLADVTGPEDEQVRVEAYAVGECRWCGRRAPLVPPATSPVELGAALAGGEPAGGHRCPRPRAPAT